MASPARTIRETRIPVPYHLGGAQVPRQGEQPQPLQGAQVQVVFPDAQTVKGADLDLQPRSLNTFKSQVFAWPTSLALGVHIVNTTDVPMRLAVQVHLQPSNAQPMMNPVLTMDVAAGDHMHASVDPANGDPWGPFAWLEVTPLAVPSAGGVQAALIRRL